MKLGLGLGLQYGRKTTSGGGEQLFLDKYSGASFAVSATRKLISSYNGDLMEVRRANNDVGYIGTVNGVLDIASLMAFSQGGLVAVPRIYSQLNASDDYVQNIVTRQGLIVDVNGDLNELNGQPVILRSADDNGGYISDFDTRTGIQNKGYFYIGKNTANKLSIIFSNTNEGAIGYYSRDVNTSPATSIISPTNERLNGATWNYVNRNGVYDDTLEQFILSANMDFNFGEASKSLGYRFSNPSNIGMFAFQEEIIFNNTDDQLSKEIDLNNFYNAY